MKNFAKIVLIGLALAGCQKSKKFSNIPFIEIKSVEIVPANTDPQLLNEHVKLTYYFTDGNGDIGLEPYMNQPPHCDTCDHYYNIFVDVNSKVNGVFELTYPYNTRLKSLTPNANNTSLEGDMIYKIDIANRLSDTIAIDFYIEDRALNKSNIGQTGPLYIDL